MVGRGGFDLIRHLQEEGIEIILVGGSCVELYTGGEYLTADLDVVVPPEERGKLADKLNEMGFEPQSPAKRIWVRGRTVVHIVGESYRGRVRNNVDLERRGIGSGKLDNVASPEDVLLDRLSACKFWNSPRDCEQAYWLLVGMRDELDWGYLRRQAGDLGVSDYLDEELLLECAGE